MPKPKQRPATQEERKELLESLIQTITPIFRVWIDSADIEVTEARQIVDKQPYKLMEVSWKEEQAYQALGWRFYWVSGEFRSDLIRGIAITSFRQNCLPGSVMQAL